MECSFKCNVLTVLTGIVGTGGRCHRYATSSGAVPHEFVAIVEFLHRIYKRND